MFFRSDNIFYILGITNYFYILLVSDYTNMMLRYKTVRWKYFLTIRDSQYCVVLTSIKQNKYMHILNKLNKCWGEINDNVKWKYQYFHSWALFQIISQYLYLYSFFQLKEKKQNQWILKWSSKLQKHWSCTNAGYCPFAFNVSSWLS